MIVGLGVIVALGVGGYYAFQSSTVPQVDTTRTASLEDALKAVPLSDVAGADYPKVPRPVGSVRSYYLQNQSVTSIVYTIKAPLTQVQADVTGALDAAGWGNISAEPTPAIHAGNSLYQAVYSDGAKVVQLQIFAEGDITATVYIIQTSRASR
ncbi:MAG: hypothetical protein QOE92_1577 [Chloroflexota bacterium]|nr:hypothetical protein [Chloroflexota bacterium]